MFSPCCLKFPSAPPSSPGLSELYRLLYDKDSCKGRINTPVLRLRSYPSESAPCKEPCRTAAGTVQKGRERKAGQTETSGSTGKT
ncbi:hypothetical protein DXC97_14050 [Lachnospiraceae bacterium TF09-5]|nr:hypothetical protein DXC97_14050 [Lachnospiraceae bacterium TF09-5]